MKFGINNYNKYYVVRAHSQKCSLTWRSRIYHEYCWKEVILFCFCHYFLSDTRSMDTCNPVQVNKVMSYSYRVPTNKNNIKNNIKLSSTTKKVSQITNYYTDSQFLLSAITFFSHERAIWTWCQRNELF